MRIARKLTLLALAATGFTASSAFATSSVEVIDYKKGGSQAQRHCGNSVGVPPNIPETRCLVHASGSMELRVDLGIFGEAHEATCSVEMLLRVAEGHRFSVTSVNNTAGDFNCPTVAPACNLPWEGTGEEDFSDVVSAQMWMCVDPAEGPSCSGYLGFDIVNQGDDHYETQFDNSSVGLCELDVGVEFEFTNTAHADIAVIHP